MGGERGHFNPSPWDQRQNTVCKSGPEDSGAHGWFLVLFPSMHFLTQAQTVRFLSFSLLLHSREGKHTC